MSELLAELQARGMLHSMTPGLVRFLQEGPQKVYIGLDPTAPSLHIGNLASLMLLKQLQQAGHQPLIVVGGATGMIGDPSFKATERSLLDEATLRFNEAAISAQIHRLFPSEGPNKPLVVNNYDWFKGLNILTFLREVGKHLSVNYLLAKEGIKTRLEQGISYTEFAYPLLQAYDFYYLYKKYGVKWQVGGSDQWGNLTAGIELIRRKAQVEAHALTTPLVTKADGTKFGKSEQGENVWLAAHMTSPYQFYQFWLNRGDQEAALLLRRMTLCNLEEIAEEEAVHAAAPHKRGLQKLLAEQVTSFVHGKKSCREAQLTTDLLFGEMSSAQLAQIGKDELAASLVGVPCLTITEQMWAEAKDVLTLLTVATGGRIFPSKRAARELIDAGAVQINQLKLTDPHQSLNFPPLPGGCYFLVKKGKKEHFLIKRV